MRQPNTLIKKWLKTVFGHFPVLLPVTGIFACVFLIAAAFNHYQLNLHVVGDGTKSIVKLENYIDSVAGDLQELNKLVGDDCSQSDKLELRSKVFSSQMLKEIGLYKDGVVYCTSNEGQTNIRIFNSTLERIEHSPKNITISLMKSKSQLKTFFIYSSSDKNTGINALLHPQQFLELISPLFDKHSYGYQIQVLDQVIQSSHIQELDSVHLYNFTSELYPFSIGIFLTNQSYYTHYMGHIGETISVALVLSLLYLMIRYNTLTKRTVEYALMDAIKQNQIELYLQPIVDIHSRRIVGSEALVRWNHPLRGQISPEEFIPLAEKLGIIDEISKFSFKEVTEFLTQNSEYCDEEKYISINISRYQIIQPTFVAFLKDYGHKHPEMAQRILLELTENVDLPPEQLDFALENLKEIQSLGFSIAIDDFGTGYSGLNLIRLMNFDVVKIDQVFIKSLHSDSNIMPVLRSMVQLATDLDMRVIAEGVETEYQIEQLEKLGVTSIQGFYYARPINPTEFALFNVMSDDAYNGSRPIPRWDAKR